MKPIAFKVRGGGNYSGTKGGTVRPNEKGGAGYLGYEDKTFTIATAPDQWILTPTALPISNPMNEPAQPTLVGKPIRYLSVCSGMEAASVAWHPLGWTPVGFSEIEPFPCAILKHRFPNTPNYGSLTEHATWPLEPKAIDLLVGGTPCQSFSVAGLRKGLADPRGNLALTFLALADRLKPRWIIWENVPGVLSSGGGRDFGSFLGALVELGYGFAYRVLDAQHFGVPQRRRRVFVVACLGDWAAAAEVLSLGESLRGYLEAGGKKRKATAPDAGRGVEAGGNLTPYRKSKRACSTTDNETWVPADASNTLNNFDLGDTRTTHAVVSCSDIAPTVTSSGPPYSRTGNERVEAEALVAHIVQASELRLRGQITEQNTVPTLLANTKNGDNHPLAVYPIAFQPVTQSDVAGPLDAHYYKGPGSRQGGEREYVAHPIAFQPGNLVRKAGADPSSETFPTLTKDSGDQSPHVATVNIYGGNKQNDRPQGGMYVRLEDTSKCLDAANGLNPTCAQGGTAVLTPMAVRRLTPTECERLQGFCDNWSQIPWKGKPADQCPDGPRYKACGNSMAVPCMRWIGEQIARYDAAKDGKPSA